MTVSDRMMMKEIVIVYASQTGQAKAIAESLNDEAEQNGFRSKLYCISRHEKEFKFDELNSPLVFVCSTTGDGEPPETAVKCFNKLKKQLNKEDRRDLLVNLNFALLGLGDSNYAQFANGPKSFYKVLTGLGAKCFYGPEYADDGVGLELVVEPFKQGLWDALAELFIATQDRSTQTSRDGEKGQSEFLDCVIDHTVTLKMSHLSLSDDDLTVPELTENHLTIELNAAQNATKQQIEYMLPLIKNIYPQSSSGIYTASLTNNSILTQKESEKDCYMLEFKLLDECEAFTYEPGHSIDIVCSNSQHEVEMLLKRLNLYEKREQIIQIKSLNASKKMGSTYVKLTSELINTISLEQFFTHCVDIRGASLKKAFLRMLAHYCTSEQDKQRLLQLSSVQGSEQYQNMIKQSHLSLLDLLNIFDSCQPQLAHLIQMLLPLTARSYTLCSSSNNLDSMQIIFNLVKFKRENNRTYERQGLATHFLSKLNKNDRLYIMKRKFQNFTFPPLDDVTKQQALIMIGPGTGIAPFLSYLRTIKTKTPEHKVKENKWLFYGCRHPNKDFLFKQEFLDDLADRVEKFSVSFSRLGEHKLDAQSSITKYHIKNSKYVQDSIKHYDKEIVELIVEKNACVMVCGDALNMSKDVQNCLAQCLLDQLPDRFEYSLEQANSYLLEMMKQKRYKQDIWA